VGRTPEEELELLRAAVVRDLRRLATDAPDSLPDDAPLKGILGRSESLLEAQAKHIDALEALDLLDTDPGGHDHALETFTRCMHVPRIVVALAEVLRQDKKSDALRPMQEDAARVAARIQHLVRAWALRQAGELREDDEEDVVDL
jgi:hypothetical protein